LRFRKVVGTGAGYNRRLSQNHKPWNIGVLGYWSDGVLEEQKSQITMTKVSVFPAAASLQTGSSTGFSFYVSFS
jgi:elongation factor P hydroxylase